MTVSDARPVVVVGGGAAGCAAARTLADAGVSTLLLEAGGADRPPELDSSDHLASVTAEDWWWPNPPRRGRGLGGSTAVNGMVVQGIDPRDARRWGWDDAMDIQAELRDRIDPTLCPPGPLTEAFGALVRRGFPLGPGTAASGGLGWLPLHLSMADGARRSAADVFCSDPPETLTVRPGCTVVGLDAERPAVVLADGERIDAAHIALAAGATNTPPLLVDAGLISANGVDEALNHWSTAIVVELPAELRVAAGIDVAPSSYLLRCRTGSTENERVDLQMLVLDHTGDSEEGRSHGAVIVTALEKERLSILELGINQAIHWLRELPGVGRVSIAQDRTPVHHHCGTLRSQVDAATHALTGVPNVSVIDASAFPELPHTNPMLTTMVGAARWARRYATL